MNSWQNVINPLLFESLSRRYREETSLGLCLISEDEPKLNACTAYRWEKLDRPSLSYSRMATESARWGEPNIVCDRRGTFVWCVPVFFNNEVVGGLFSALDPSDAARDCARAVREASWKLLTLAEERNICNAAHMQRNRLVAQMNAKRAEAIHHSKRFYFQNPRDIYLIEERQLITAIRNRDLELAREIINRILVGVYHVGNRNFDILKPLVLEIIVQMYRAAVEEGADPVDLLGVNSVFLVEFLKVKDEYELNRWLTHWLEIFVNTTFETNVTATPPSLAPALLYIRNNIDKPITRDRVARACNLSPSYFSKLFKRGTGYTFGTLLNRFRVEQACELLKETTMSASEVAFACGYNDQSYFTKVFRSLVGSPPGQYRRRARAHIYQKSSLFYKTS